MRQYTPKTLEILSQRPDIPKTYSVSTWNEVFKWYASGKKSHPKFIITDDYTLGLYLKIVYYYALIKSCSLNIDNISTLPEELQNGFFGLDITTLNFLIPHRVSWYFTDLNTFSDACSLYYKGINIFPDLYGDKARQYIPVESHKEIIRQCMKNTSKKKIID